jgi:transcription elongation factor Elf1
MTKALAKCGNCGKWFEIPLYRLKEFKNLRKQTPKLTLMCGKCSIM